MDKLVKLNAQTAGRDKLARLLQYLSKVIWYKLQQNNKNGIDTFKNLEFQLSSFRKLLRFGRCIDTAYSILSLLKYEDNTVKSTVILSKIFNGLFLLADHILWLGRSDLCSVNTDKWGRISTRYWLYMLSANLLRDLYEISNILQLHKDKILTKNINGLSGILRVTGNALVYIQKYPHVMVDVIKNSCDILIPLTALGYVKLSPGTVGLFGTISSLAGLIVLLEPQCKLSPS